MRATTHPDLRAQATAPAGLTVGGGFRHLLKNTEVKPKTVGPPRDNQHMTTRDALAAMTSTCTCTKNYGTTRWGTCTVCHLRKP